MSNERNNVHNHICANSGPLARRRNEGEKRVFADFKSWRAARRGRVLNFETQMSISATPNANKQIESEEETFRRGEVQVFNIRYAVRCFSCRLENRKLKRKRRRKVGQMVKNFQAKQLVRRQMMINIPKTHFTGGRRNVCSLDGGGWAESRR